MASGLKLTSCFFFFSPSPDPQPFFPLIIRPPVRKVSHSPAVSARSKCIESTRYSDFRHHFIRVHIWIGLDSHKWTCFIHDVEVYFTKPLVVLHSSSIRSLVLFIYFLFIPF